MRNIFHTELPSRRNLLTKTYVKKFPTSLKFSDFYKLWNTFFCNVYKHLSTSPFVNFVKMLSRFSENWSFLSWRIFLLVITQFYSFGLTNKSINYENNKFKWLPICPPPPHLIPLPSAVKWDPVIKTSSVGNFLTNRQ